MHIRRHQEQFNDGGQVPHRQSQRGSTSARFRQSHRSGIFMNPTAKKLYFLGPISESDRVLWLNGNRVFFFVR